MHETIPENLTRDVLGAFCSGVVVVTATAGEEPVGFTCQSFTSLSLTPPLVSFAPSRGSRTWPRIRASDAFCINILAADQQHLSQQFAQSGDDKFAGVAWTPGVLGSPVLDGVLGWTDCTLWTEYDGGDHTIAIGRVHDLASCDNRRPLLFHRGAYA